MASTKEETNDEKLIYLCEMFQDINIDVLLEMYQENHLLPLEELVEKCLVINESESGTTEEEAEVEGSEQFVAEVSLTPAVFQSAAKVPEALRSEDVKPSAIPNEEQSVLEDVLREHLIFMKTKQSMKTNLNCVNFVKKCVQKILQNGGDEKYRIIKLDHPKVQKKVSLPGCLQLFLHVGWTQSERLLLFSSIDELQIHNICETLEKISQNLEIEEENERKNLLNTMGTANQVNIHTNRKRKAVLSPSENRKKKLSPEELRQRRLNAFGNGTSPRQSNYTGTGPRLGRDYNPKVKNMTQQLKDLRKEKQRKWRNKRGARKRVFTMRDIEKLTQKDHDMKSKGTEAKNEMNRIGLESLRLTNEFRARHGLPPCEWSQPMADVGEVHSRDMGTGRVPVGHQGFNERITKFPHRAMSAAENVAMSQGMPDVAKTSVDGWIDSPGHRKNLLSNHRWCGIGVYRNSSGAYYSTQLFANF